MSSELSQSSTSSSSDSSSINIDALLSDENVQKLSDVLFYRFLLNAAKSIRSSNFLQQYKNQIQNLIVFYKGRRIRELQTDDFFLMNKYIFLYIKDNFEEMDSFVKDYIKQYEINDFKRVSELWKMLKDFLKIDNKSDANKDTLDNPQALNEDFNKFLLCLVNEEVANWHGTQSFDLNFIKENKSKFFRYTKEFAKAFIIFIIDMPAYVVLMDEEQPVYELKIYLIETIRPPYDHDALYVFSQKDSKKTISTSNSDKDLSNEDQTASVSTNRLGPNDLNKDISSSSLPLGKRLNSTKDQIEANEDLKINEEENIEQVPLQSNNGNLNSLKENLDSSNKNISKYFSEIRKRFELNNKQTFRFFSFITIKKSSILIIMFKILLSFLSISDIILDLILAYNFFKSGQILYGILTILILLIVGTVNIFLERMNLKKYKLVTDYLPSRLNFDLVRYVCSFLQMSSFFATLKSSIMSIKAAKEPQIVTLLKNPSQANNAELQYESQKLKYIETYLEALPQSVLQLIIVLKTKDCGWWQLLSLVSGVLNINFTSSTFYATEKDINLIDIWKHLKLILITFCYNGYLITSYSLLFWQFHWTVGLFRIALFFFISSSSKIDREDLKLIFMNRKFSKIKFSQIFNKITLIDNAVLSICIFILKLDQLKDSYFVALFACQISFSIIWIGLIVRNKFYFSINLMHIPFFVNNA